MGDVQGLVNDFATKLSKRKVEGSRETARMTAELLRTIISQQKMTSSTNHAAVLIDTVRGVGRRLIDANPVELAVGNIVRRVLYIIREEEFSLQAGELTLSSQGSDREIDEEDDKLFLSSAATSQRILHPTSLATLLGSKPDMPPTCHPSASRNHDIEGKGNPSSLTLKRHIMEAVNYLIEDIKTCHEQIADQAVELIHQNEVVLTLGHSRTVKKFLCAAKEKKRSFQVVVAEGAPKYLGHVLAKGLAAKGLQTTVIADSSVFAMISRVNMVVVGVHAVMANGGVIAPVGMNMVALAARKHAVPFVVVAGTHKLCPLYPNNPEVLLNDMRCPSELLSFGEFSDCMDFSIGSEAPLLHVLNPAFDYVPPELVSLFVTDTGGHTPSFIYRLISEFYSADDLALQQKLLPESEHSNSI
ncbi:translation initiation factor eIF-2B subunit beta [Prunus yedoensis var. nudiflora]|uniref:Translation initiation factor eIF2B subunit beta n=1 Tax=Prunus yedoensis var. nudiflora TaxID=2094558 RepID=A0A314XVK9_PRUYE|nr:translation initiation factor eIF-2B subunit beta [Prunus yedoensis var. nudiflora]